MERLTRNSIPGILCGIVIMFLTVLPGSLFPHVKPVVGLDKVAHILMYAGFTFACLWGYRKQFVSNGLAYKKRAVLLAIVISIAYGGLTEMIQEHIVPTRTGDWFDFVADSIGTMLGALVFYLFFHRKK
ncbi:MAG: VanZ family protein [Bacteroidales bacterium]|nr:VanZ family protein [Bacteroidales bacterium]MBR6930858.1 VanZ family protein [Bacteroidales bacterium]